MADAHLKRGQSVVIDYQEGDDADAHFVGAATFWKAVTEKDCQRLRSSRAALEIVANDPRVLVQLPGVTGTIEFPARCVRVA